MSTRDHGFSEATPVGTHPARLAFAVFGGTAPWTLHLIGSYAVASYACGEAAGIWALHLLTLITALVAGTAVLVSINILRRATSRPKGERGPEQDRDQFLASGGVLLGTLGLMAIVLGELGVVMVGCGM